MARRAPLVSLVAVAAASACSDTTTTPGPGPGPSGPACKYVGTVEGADTAERPLTTAECWFVGTLNPLSGPLGAVGLALENAARLAVRDVNKAGGAAGKKLCLVACDDQTNSMLDEAIVAGLVRDYHIVALNGAAASSSSLEAAKASKAAGIAQISCCSTSPALSLDPQIYRTVPSDALQGIVLASVARGLEEPAERVAIVHVNDTYGDSLKDVFLGAFEGLNGQVTRSVAYKPGEPSYTKILEQALDPLPDHAVLIAFPADGAQILRDWYLSGLAPKLRWLATDGLKDPRFVVAGGLVTDQVIGTAPQLEGTHFAGFKGRYSAAFGGEAPGIFTSNQYDAMILIALGIARAGPAGRPMDVRARIPEVASAPGMPVSADRAEDLATALRLAGEGDVDYSGASGELEMDARGDVITDYGVWRVNTSSLTDTRDCWTCTATSALVHCREKSCG